MPSSVQELYRARLAEIDQRVNGRLSSAVNAQTRFADLLTEAMSPKIITASPADGEVVLSKSDTEDPMQAMMRMMSASMSMSGLGALSGGSDSGSSISSSMSSMMSMLMMQQLFDRLDKLASGSETEAMAETAAVEVVSGVEETREADASPLSDVLAFDDIIMEAALTFQVDSDLIHGVIQAESGYRAEAVSSKGAQGLMQLMPGTAEDMGVDDPFDPEQNVMGGTAYLSYLLDRYQGDERLALAAYNCGPAKVDSYGITDSSDPEQYGRLPQSVRAYIDKVFQYTQARAAG